MTIQTIDGATLHRMAPELLNQWSGPALIEHARKLGGEACAWGVAFALRLERDRVAQLLNHFRLGIGAATPGERLARRLVFTVREARATLRTAWKVSGEMRWRQ
jgi:hypothetical protein